jgi:hypothetical protein
MPRQADKVYFVVLDGDSPPDWRPWNEALSVLKQTVESDELALALAEREQPHFEIGLLLHPPEMLRSRPQKDVTRIAGVIVDGMSYISNPARAEAIRQDYSLLCNKIAGAGPSCWCQRVGFHTVMAVDGSVDAFSECRLALQQIASEAFGWSVPHRVTPVRGDAYLPFAIQAIEVEMMAAHKRWMAQSSFRSV